MMLALLCALSLVSFSYGDFACICNYNVESGVYSTPDVSGSPIGYLYEFDCKPSLPKLSSTGTDGSWLAVQYEGQIGYILKDSNIEIQTCPGTPTDTDLIPTSTTAPHGTRPSTGRTDIGTQSEAFTSPTIAQSTTTTTTETTTTTIKPTTPIPTTMKPTTTSSTTTALPSSQFRDTNIPISSMQTDTSTVPLTLPPTSVAATTRTTMPSATTTKPTTTMESISSCPAAIKSLASGTNSPLGHHDNSCYLLHSGIMHWNDAESWCSSHGNGHLVHIESAGEQTYLLQFLNQNYNHHSIWIGLSDQRSEGTYHWTSGDAVTYTNWAANQEMSFIHSIEDCVVMDTHSLHGTWDDRDCTFEFYGFLCEYDTSTTGISGGAHVIVTPPSTSGDGNTNLCPSSAIYHNHLNNGILAQHDRACYEILPDTKYSWEHAENLCQASGGHLAHISNQQEQDFVQGFLQRHFADRAVWIGLNDVSHEGKFEWTAGTSVSYTNWLPGHESNTLGGASFEDCAVLVPYKQGKWDDVHCGYEEIFGVDSGEIHYPLCQYRHCKEIQGVYARKLSLWTNAPEIPSSSVPIIG